MTTEHLRLVLDTVQDSQLLFKLVTIVQSRNSNNDREVRLGRLTALQKPNGGVQAATALFQHALSTRAGTECVVHALQS